MATRRGRGQAEHHDVDVCAVPGGSVYVSEVSDGGVDVDGFFVEADAVSVRRYAAYMAEHGWVTPPLQWASQLRRLDDPVVGVGPDDAARFAASVGGRLPTVWEWQRLARGRFGLAPAPMGEPFGVRGLCQRWEWTSTPTRSGYWVCGGRYRDRPQIAGAVGHLAYEDAAALDVGFRVVRHERPEATVTTTHPPSTLDERPPTPTKIERSLDESLAEDFSVPPRAVWRADDVVILTAGPQVVGREGVPREVELRALWLGQQGSGLRRPALVSTMYRGEFSDARVNARLVWHALREGRDVAEGARGLQLGRVVDDMAPAIVESTCAGLPLRVFLTAHGAHDEGRAQGHMPVEVALGFALQVLERGVLPAALQLRTDMYGEGQLAWDGTWHPRFDLELTRPMTQRQRWNRTFMGGYLDLSPEVILGQAQTPRMAVYSAGNLLYRLLTGQRPFDVAITGSTMDQLRAAADRDGRRSVAERRPDLDAALVAIVDGAVAFSPDDRPNNLEALVEQWRGALDRVAAANDQVVGEDEVASFMAALMAEYFPRTRQAELQWWDEASMLSLDDAVVLDTAPWPTPPATAEAFAAAIDDAAAYNEIIT